MASLVIHGDLEARESPLQRPVYTRPILKPDPMDINRWEYIPDDVLPADLIHRAVLRMYEGEAGADATASTVRVIKLTSIIGDASHPFDRTVSPLARLLDYLSWKYRILFVVSVGNCTADIEIDGSFGILRQIGTT